MFLFLHMLYSKKLENANSKEWVVFIHGAGGSSSIWHKQIKTFSEKYNLLLIDLRGHGKSQMETKKKRYSFKLIAQDVIEVMHAQQIERAHFVGVSLGSIVIKQIELLEPDLVKSMIFAGAITRLNFKSRLLLKAGRVLNRLIPQMGLYQLFARIMMPRKNHASSRELFIGEARKIVQKEFNRWFKLTSRLALYLIELEKQTDKTPTLFIMGEEDHLFLAPVKELVAQNPRLNLSIVPNCGHVVNFEQADTFNHHSLIFIDQVSA